MAAAVGVVGALVGVGSSIWGGISQSKAAKRAKRQANKDADVIEKLGRKEAKQIIRAGSKVIGEQYTGYAGSGVDVNTGTPLDVLAESVSEIQRTARHAMRSRIDQARSVRHGGNAASVIGQANATNSILGGAQIGIQGIASYLRGD